MQKSRSTAGADSASWSWRLTLVSGLVGVAFALITLHPEFVLGTGARWQLPRPDLVAYLAALDYYIRDDWRFPLFAVPEMGFPEGGSVIYNDAIPILAAATKAWAGLTGLYPNPLGFWLLACYVLMAVLVGRLVTAAGSPTRVGTLALVAMVFSSLVFMIRIEHIALASQFLIVWVLLLYVRVRQGRWPAVQISLFVPVAPLINAYLFAMGAALLLAVFLTGWQRREWRRTVLATAAVAVVLFTTVLMVAGFVGGQLSPRQLSTSGWGRYSWNLLTLVAPPPGYWSWSIPGLVRDATGGQYEGESYLGIGAVVLIALCLVAAPRETWAAVRRHKRLVAILAALAAFAASGRVFFGSSLLLDVPVPGLVERVFGLFRVGGRFIWPTVYVLTLAPALILARRMPARGWTVLVVAAATMQTVEAWPVRQMVRQYTASGEPDLIGAPAMRAWIGSHARVWQYPSWFCGGLGRGEATAENLKRETQIQIIAARLGRPMNSIYMARPLKDCAREAAEASGLTLRDDTLYIFADAAVANVPRIAALAATPHCRDLEWGFVCSSRWAGRGPTQAGNDAPH